ncbi:hypothetical protein LV457_04665 [Mycobacterium sp. MYCO198283]|uniref:Rv3212 family protein n=1 Tax=Mycobacterium sp. MYCO198283 TaxID=2883505 RepID=UPI001E4F17C1|nr:hypothetical protein [Mycobacterium sp. MYCO198283]MCG5431582.1 hypothetical protein [Mycobacterium sp. MYCO198283]
MIRPERRTRGDLVAAAAIALVVVLVGAGIWWTSDARGTVSRPAAAPAPALTDAGAVPGRLRPLWSAASPETTSPVVVGGTVVTGAGREVAGRDPNTGLARWTYARDRELCGVTWVYDYALAVYPDDRGCGQVSGIRGDDGRRGPSRTSYADPAVRLSTDGTSVLSAGDTRLELWRSDLVRSLSYGTLDAPVNPSPFPGPACRFVSSAGATSAVSVLEDCPDAADLRLTLLRPADDEDKPTRKTVPLPGVRPDSGAAVVAVADVRTAVYLPTPSPHVAVYDDTGTVIADTLLPRAPTAGGVTRAGNLVTWFTGDSVMVFDYYLTYKFTVASSPTSAPVGPATMMAGKLLVPVTNGVAVLDAATGAGGGVIPLTREPGVRVVPAVAGTTLLEQRGDMLVGLGP